MADAGGFISEHRKDLHRCYGMFVGRKKVQKWRRVKNTYVAVKFAERPLILIRLKNVR